MARTLTSEVNTATQDTVTTPRYLVQLGWSSISRLSSREAVTWNGYAWVPNLIKSVNVSNAGINSRAVVVLHNYDTSFGALALNEGLQDLWVSIWSLYGSSPFATADAMLL